MLLLQLETSYVPLAAVTRLLHGLLCVLAHLDNVSHSGGRGMGLVDYRTTPSTLRYLLSLQKFLMSIIGNKHPPLPLTLGDIHPQSSALVVISLTLVS